jgi:hypothetical protein
LPDAQFQELLVKTNVAAQQGNAEKDAAQQDTAKRPACSASAAAANSALSPSKAEGLPQRAFYLKCVRGRSYSALGVLQGNWIAKMVFKLRKSGKCLRCLFHHGVLLR